ncbi:MAG: hypothetical protein AAF236_12745 [Verrucomicrobiota bacterium]
MARLDPERIDIAASADVSDRNNGDAPGSNEPEKLVRLDAAGNRSAVDGDISHRENLDLTGVGDRCADAGRPRRRGGKHRDGGRDGNVAGRANRHVSSVTHETIDPETVGRDVSLRGDDDIAIASNVSKDSISQARHEVARGVDRDIAIAGDGGVDDIGK